MTDIVERLRRGTPCIGSEGPCEVRDTRSGCECAEAADEIERLRAFIESLDGMHVGRRADDRFIDEAIIVASDVLEQKAPKPLAVLEPHAYMPSAMHMGDCAICGHLQGSAIHSIFRRS
jgi:hypothetical protein